MNDYTARIVRGFATVCLVASTAACATVTRGTTQEFKVVSVPPGAEVKTSTGNFCASTPCSMKISRKAGFDVTVRKAGYKPSVSHIEAKMSGGGGAGLAGNVLIGGIIGIAVDAHNGSMNDLNPNPLSVTLEPETSAAPASPSSPNG